MECQRHSTKLMKNNSIPKYAAYRPNNCKIIGDMVYGDCLGKNHKLYRLDLPYINGIHVNKQCECNEIISLHNRHLNTNEMIANRKRHRLLVHNAYQRFRTVVPPKPIQPITHIEVVKQAPQSKRKLYARAAETLRCREICESDFRIEAFIKHERMAKHTKPPRMIQARGAVYCVDISRYLNPIENYVLHLPEDITISLKGRNNYEAARILRNRWDKYKDPVAILADHSFYDAKQDTTWLEAEKEYNMEFCPNDEHFSMLFDAQTYNVGVCKKSRMKYHVEGSRMSGERNTSLGNSTNNAAALGWMARNVVHDVIVEGDDSVIFFEREDIDKIDYQVLTDLQMGTTYSIVYDFEKVEFCQKQPVLTDNGWLLVRNPLRVMSRSSTCINPSYTTSVELAKRWYHTMGDGEYNSNKGVPVIQSWAKYLRSLHNKKVQLSNDDTYGKHYKPNELSEHISDACRSSFHAAFGISPTLQKEMEKSYDELHNNELVAVNVTNEYVQDLEGKFAMDELGIFIE